MSADLNSSLGHERWERIQSIFAEALDLEPERRRGFIETRCEGDRPLADSVFEMLRADSEYGSLLDQDPAQAIGQVVDETLQSDHLRSLVQRQIGPYRLLRVLGEGGMGIVYLAERTDIGGLVAIKLLRDAWMSPMRRERFMLEQQTLVKLNHPAIARLYDASAMEDGTPWFVMEYADGKPLVSYLAERGGSVRDRLLLFLRVCEAVQYAHSHAIIHRDLKPSNILVTAKGEVKLLDFGIAKQIQSEASPENRTVAGLRMLTPGYAAPEQHTGSHVGVFTDVYTLGVLLYEILTGKLPNADEALAGRSPEKPSTLARIAGSKLSGLQLSKQELADFDVLCLTALRPEPERRYRSVDAFSRDITAYLEGRVLEARQNSVGYTLRKFAQRNRMALAAVAAVLLIVIGGTVFFTMRLARARNAALAEAKRTERIQHFMLDMLGNEDSEAAPSNELKVVTLLDRAAQQAETLRGDAATQADLYQTLGSMYSRLGKYEQSEQLLTKALEASRSSSDNTHLKSAEILVELGTLRGDRGDLKNAKKDVEQALQLTTAARLPVDSSTIVHAQIAMGRIEAQGGEYQKAVDQLIPITKLAVVQKGDRRYDLRDSLAYLAVAEHGTQREDLAEATVLRAIDLDKELLGAQHIQTGIDLVNLATTKLQRGDYPGADPLYRQGMAIMQAWYGADHPDVATNLSIFARLLVAENKPLEAELILTRVLSIQERAYGPIHERVAFTLDTLGQINILKGDLASAEADFSRAVAISRSVFGDLGTRTGYELGNLGNVYLKQHKDKLAEATLMQCVEVLASLPPGNSLIGTARARWGRSLLALKQYKRAEEQLQASRLSLMAQYTKPTEELANVNKDLGTLALLIHPAEKSEASKTERRPKSATPKGLKQLRG